MSTRIAAAIIGIVFGVVLSWSGMTNPDVIREGLLFQSAYLFAFFALAMLTATTGLTILRRRAPRAILTGERIGWEPVKPERRHVVGSAIFGVGWSAACVCPGPIATQLGQGIWYAIPTTLGLAVGILVFRRLQERAEDGAQRTPASSVIPSKVAADATA